MNSAKENYIDYFSDFVKTKSPSAASPSIARKDLGTLDGGQPLNPHQSRRGTKKRSGLVKTLAFSCDTDGLHRGSPEPATLIRHPSLPGRAEAMQVRAMEP